jgi:3',5'-cyclic AMP phosphodiesterase CpdA
MKKHLWSKTSLLMAALAIAFIGGALARAGFSKKQAFAEHIRIIDGMPVTDEPTIRLAAIGDVRSGDERQAAVASVLDSVHRENPLDGVILLGDNTLLRGAPANALTRTFTIPYAFLLERNVPFFAVLGNHDLRRGMKEYQLYFPGFNMNGRPYYSKTFGDDAVEVFFLDSNEMEKDVQQIRWLEQALEQSSAEWKVIATHHPLYSTANHHPAGEGLRGRLEPILVHNGVDLVLSGHNHIYERLQPVNGITHITSGSGGELRKGDLGRSNPLLAAGNDSDNVALILEFSGDICRFAAYAADGKLVDEGALTPEHADITQSDFRSPR